MPPLAGYSKRAVTSLAGPEGMGGQKRSVGVLRQELIFFPTRILSKERRPSGARLAL